MKNNYDNYIKHFTLEKFPKLRCLHCDNYLELIKDSFKQEVTPKSKEFSDDVGEMSVLDLRFTAFLKCSCGELFAISGVGEVEEELKEDYLTGNLDERYIEFFEIKSIYPTISFFKIDENCPGEIKKSIVESFGLFWADTSSSGNKIRKTIELIMDKFGIVSIKKNKKEKDYYLSLDERIKEFGKINDKNKEISNLLLGLKWLGNAGSHKENLSKEDILDAYSVLSHTIDDLFVYDGRKKEALEKSKKIEAKYKK